LDLLAKQAAQPETQVQLPVEKINAELAAENAPLKAQLDYVDIRIERMENIQVAEKRFSDLYCRASELKRNGASDSVVEGVIDNCQSALEKLEHLESQLQNS
jgi:hypothetical protein